VYFLCKLNHSLLSAKTQVEKIPLSFVATQHPFAIVAGGLGLRRAHIGEVRL
jgi:hypothetical protein